MTRCYMQIISPSGKRVRCPADATEYRSGVPVCRHHTEPEPVKKK